MKRRSLGIAVAVFTLAAASAVAQDTCPCPEEPEPGWRTSIGFGFAYTSGNTDTQNLNLSFDVIHDPKTKNVFKANGLWIRNKSDGELSADRAAFTVRDEYTFSGRTFAFVSGLGGQSIRSQQRCLPATYPSATISFRPTSKGGAGMISRSRNTLR